MQTSFCLAQYVNKFLGWLKKFGPAQNILGPVKGQGISHQNSSPKFVTKISHQNSSPFVSKIHHQNSSPKFVTKLRHQISSPKLSQNFVILCENRITHHSFSLCSKAMICPDFQRCCKSLKDLPLKMKVMSNSTLSFFKNCI